MSQLLKSDFSRIGILWNVDIDNFLFEMKLNVRYRNTKVFLLNIIFLKSNTNSGILWSIAFKTNCTHHVFMSPSCFFL